MENHVSTGGGADNATGTIKEITFTPHEEYPGAAADTAEFLAAVQNAVANIRSADGHDKRGMASCDPQLCLYTADI